MAEGCASTAEHEGITALALDGSPIPINALSELYILQGAAGRWAFGRGLDLRGEDVRPIDMFDIIGGTGIGGFYAVLFASLKMTIGQAIQSHGILERRLFRSDAWNNKIQQACVESLSTALDEIVKVFEIKTSLDSSFEEKNCETKCFVCAINMAATACCRLLRNYRSRTGQGPWCTIEQVLRVTLSNNVQFPSVRIGEERFLSGLHGYANPTHVLVKELCNAFVKGTQVACLANVGTGDPSVQHLKKQRDLEELSGLLRFCQVVADDVAAQCYSLGSFFFRFSVPLRLEQEFCSPEDAISQVIGLTMSYISSNEISKKLDDWEEKLRDHLGVVSIERLNSVAAKDGESRVAARLAKVEEHLDGNIFQDVKKWLKPIHQTSKLDANIRARSGTTCQWLLNNDTFVQWMEKKRGLFWFRGLMGTGKTVMSSFVIETLLKRGDFYIAYYYFEFTNPTTLSEEAVLRSLVCQLAGVSTPIVRTFHEKHNNGVLQPQLASLQNTLNELIAASTKPVFIIIDALDELPVTPRKYFLQSLVTFSASESAFRTHIMVTSREEVDIHRAFKHHVDFELGVQGDLVRQDIAAFVDRELGSEKWTFWPRDDIEMARCLLNERADGQFRMVACQIDILQQVHTYEQLHQSLHSLPKSLGETYSYILENIPEHLRDQAFRLFAILVFAFESISIDELSALLAVELGDEEDSTNLPIFRKKTQFVDPLDIVSLGTSLVSQIRDKDNIALQLAHASVKEHFLAPRKAWFSLHEDAAHRMIARSCIALLVEIHDLQQEDKDDSLFPYSRCYWPHHIFPNGPQQLLHQQESLYLDFYHSNILYESHSEMYDLFYYVGAAISFIEWAASLGLVDLLKTLLDAESWHEEDLVDSFVASIHSERDEHIRMQCCHAISISDVDTNALTADGTLLYLALTSFDGLEVTKALIERGADINADGGDHGPALHGGAETGSLQIVRFLVENGADVNSIGGEYGSALQAGASAGSLEVVRFLVENGADVNPIGGEYGSALQTGARWGRLEIVRFLVENGADVNSIGGHCGSALQAGSQRGSLEIVRFLVENGADVNSIGGRYGSALQASAHHGSLEVVRFLVENGADVNSIGGHYGSALQAGAHRGSLEVVRFLVENGADVNSIGGEYGSALQAGAQCRCLEVVRFLVENGADVNARGGHYGSALQAGALHESLEIVRFLIENEADVNSIGGEYGSALQAGAHRGSLEVVRFLVENGADVNSIGGHYGSALQAGALRENLEIVRFLVENGADVNSIGGEYGSALQAGAHRGSLEVVRFLVENGADVNSIGGHYGSALQAGALRENLEIVRFLVENGADVNSIGGEYGSALQAGAGWGNLEVVRFLVENGADVNAIGSDGKTALDAVQGSVYGNFTKRQKVDQFLKSHGSKTVREIARLRHSKYLQLVCI
ncbi:ankyrin repeat-containing domain protein [Flagelloscypha sp. PMI_526]|nr:ankyrin repeat-containing domain protein [Flagelloscypha sp. PMI_526]